MVREKDRHYHNIVNNLKQAEEALIKNIEEQALLLDNIDTQIWYLKDAETYGAVNQAHADFFRVKNEDLENKSLYDIMESENEVITCITGYKDVFEKKQQVRTEEWVTDGKGENRLLSITKTPKLDHNNNVEYVVCSAEDITERRWIEDREHSRNQILTSLAAGKPLDAILELIARSVEAENSGALCSILLMDDEEQHLLHGAAPSLPDFYNQAIHGLKIGSGVGSCGSAAYTGQRVVVEDIFVHPYWADFRELAQKANLRSCWSEPVFSASGKVLATFAIYYREPRSPSSEDIERIKTPADLTSLVIERKQAEEDLRKRLEQLSSFFEQGNISLSIIDENMRYLEVNKLATRNIGSQIEGIIGKTIYEVVPEFAREIEQFFKKVLETGQAEQNIEVSGKMPGRQDEIVYWLSAPLTLPNGRPGIGVTAVDISDRKRAEEKLRKSEECLRLLTNNMLDMVSKTDKEGILQYVSPSHKDILGYEPEELLGKTIYDLVHPEEQERIVKKIKEAIISRSQKRAEFRCKHARGHYLWLETFGKLFLCKEGKVSGAIFSSRDITGRKNAEEDRLDTLNKLRKAVEGIVQTVGRIIEKKDQYTAGHQQRVARIACAIAEEMGLEEVRIEGLRLAAEIHDIGKIAVPGEILTKPGELNGLEYGIIKNHPRIGYEILENIELPWPIADIIAQHHEKINGSGYNCGLSGEEILLEARILCVADVVEAMSSHRPYRPALGIEKALEEISQKKGILFDAEVVDNCIKLFKEKGFVLE